MIFLERFVPLRQKKKLFLQVIYAVRVKRICNAYYHLNVLVVDIRIQYKYFVHVSFVVPRRMLQVYIDPLGSKNTSSASDNLFSSENYMNHAKCKTRHFTSNWTCVAAFIKYFQNIFSNHLLFNLPLYFFFNYDHEGRPESLQFCNPRCTRSHYISTTLHIDKSGQLWLGLIKLINCWLHFIPE